MYRNDERKVHHGPLSGPNRHRWALLQQVLALVGLLALAYVPLALLLFPAALPTPSATTLAILTPPPAPLSSAPPEPPTAPAASEARHHPADVKRLAEQQAAIDRLTLAAARAGDAAAADAARAREQARASAQATAAAEAARDQALSERDEARARADKLAREARAAQAALDSVRAAGGDANITDYAAAVPVPWAAKPWRAQLGNAAWHFLHTLAARYPERPPADHQRAAHDLLRALQYLYPCDECRNHLNRNLRRVPGLWPPKVESREALSQWLCKLHNLVNTQLSKPVFPCAVRQLDQRYVANCDECVTDPSVAAAEDASPLERPEHDSVAAAARSESVRLQAERRGWRDVDADSDAAAQAATAENDVDAAVDTAALTPQQKRERLLKQKQAVSGRLRPLEPERKYTGGSSLDEAPPCTYKVESWHQGSHHIDNRKVNIVVLFSPTCHVCKVYLPREIQQAHVKFAGRGLNLVAIADVTPETESLLAQFVDEEKLTYPIGIAPSDMVGAPYDKFIGKYKGVPAVLEIDPVSCTVRKQLWGWRIEQFDEYLEQRLPAKE